MCALQCGIILHITQQYTLLVKVQHVADSQDMTYQLSKGKGKLRKL